MQKKIKKQTDWKYPRKVFLVFLFFILVIFGRYVYLALSPTVNGINIQTFAANRNTVSRTLNAKRGTIYDVTGNVLAQNVTSYTLIAYLDESRSTNGKTNHVEDIESTANALAEVLETDAESLKTIMENGKKDGRYQVEFGTAGKNITELKKGEIENLNLPGIDFIESYKRYYPNGDFASYILGYAKTNKYVNKEGKTVSSIDGELGIEAKFDDILKGTDGYLRYQQDRFGYQIPDTSEERIDAIDGSDIYLTIDSSIQRFVETEIQNIEETYEPEWALIAVMDAKTGDILASGSSPSFDPNIRNITNYENPLVSNAFEPGSTMKIYTYMCAMEKGTYKGDETFESGSIQVADAIIRDWNNKGWGTITYDKGFEYSSNVGVSTMIGHFIDKDDLRNCFKEYGFGTTTGVDLAREVNGSLDFQYPVEVANAAFGQGITTTAIQHLKALSMIANDGKEVTPHVVAKIVDPNTGETTYEREVETSEQLVSSETIDKIKDLMYNVVNSDDPVASGTKYKIEGFDIIGKTGTAQLYDAENGGYLTGSNDYLYSFAGMYPKDDPEIIIYAAVRRPNVGTTNAVSDAVNNLMKNIAKYKNMFTENTENTSSVSSLILDSYINEKVSDVQNIFNENKIQTVIIGNGDKIISQYPNKGEEVLSYDKVFLITNGSEGLMPDLTGYSRSEVIYLMEALNYDYQIEGYGHVTNQSIKAGDPVTGTIKITLSS